MLTLTKSNVANAMQWLNTERNINNVRYQKNVLESARDWKSVELHLPPIDVVKSLTVQTQIMIRR